MGIINYKYDCVKWNIELTLSLHYIEVKYPIPQPSIRTVNISHPLYHILFLNISRLNIQTEINL